LQNRRLEKKNKVALFEHTCKVKDERIVKTVMLEMVEDDRQHERPSRRWSDDIMDWMIGTAIN